MSIKDVEENAVTVRARSAHQVAVDPGKISVFGGFERKTAETVAKAHPYLA